MDKSIFDDKNYDDVLFRKVLVGIVTFMYKKVRFTQIVKKNVEIIEIPFYPAQTGSQQFIVDAYSDVEAYYKKNCKAVTEGNTMPVPNGIVKLKGVTINKNHFTSQNVRTNITTKKETDFGVMGNTESVRTTMIPLTMTYDVEITTASTVDQYKAAESIIAEFIGVRKFFIGNYKGYRMLPVLIGFPEQFQLQSLLQFAPGDDTNRRKMEFSMEVLTWLPRPLVDSHMKANERINLFKVTAEAKGSGTK